MFGVELKEYLRQFEDFDAQHGGFVSPVHEDQQNAIKEGMATEIIHEIIFPLHWDVVIDGDVNPVALVYPSDYFHERFGNKFEFLSIPGRIEEVRYVFENYILRDIEKSEMLHSRRMRNKVEGDIDIRCT